jgi:Family of unknown function (DUF6523)
MHSSSSFSVYRDQEKRKDGIGRSYPQLRKARDQLEFGYKLAFKGLSEEQAIEIKVIEPKEQKGFIDNVKNAFSFGGKRYARDRQAERVEHDVAFL